MIHLIYHRAIILHKISKPKIIAYVFIKLFFNIVKTKKVMMNINANIKTNVLLDKEMTINLIIK